MDGSKEETAGQPLGKLAGVVLAVWWLLGLLPVAAPMFGFAFLPSIEWASKTNLPGIAAGLVSSVVLLLLVLLNIHRVKGGKATKAWGVLVITWLGYYIGKHVIVLAGPMILALIAGHQVELPFTVVRADDYGTRHCQDPLELQGLPFLFDRVCGVAGDFRQGLASGSRIVVIGRGTSLGVYAESLRRID
ncbi:hypothetical protein IB238_11320 [Rhizobium sp. ARZ01]|uniref:hypothetical protein n=1 Tax=Rhizobium sp. ARZ01 TaxID=2769313 RepID=UPI001784F63D|nr:hypothetical protein [Rhizobium sp. ARZ01]MBD9373207.1 hypothetical protein [Rhizobium sp. ARZ01]